jgi:ribosomal protein S18 acetylase RimI-like enzyme
LKPVEDPQALSDSGDAAMPHSLPFSPRIRQFEAAGFRAWPAASVTYDGAWMVRLTASHPAKRLNSINSLDPGDTSAVGPRLARAAQKFRAYGRPLTVRVTPLTPSALSDWCDEHGWAFAGASLVMEASIAQLAGDDVMDRLPVRDIARFVDAAITTGSVISDNRAGLSEIISSVEPNKGLFLREADGVAQSSLVCVQEGELAGIFEVATRAQDRRKGHARALIRSAAKWAAGHGARKAWLQVEEANVAALDLYAQLGFSPFYRYHYRLAPNGAFL